MTSLFRISDTEREFLCFDTEVTQPDKEFIINSWNEIRTTHPDWDRMDCVMELRENYLPKRGLQAEYAWDEDMILK